MQIVAIAITCAALLGHTLLGCCWHHEHAARGGDPAATGGCVAQGKSHHHREGHRHPHAESHGDHAASHDRNHALPQGANAGSPTSEDTEHEDACDEARCVFVGPQAAPAVECPGSQQAAIYFVVANPPVACGVPAATFDLHSHSLCAGTLRLHLLHLVLLI